MFSGLDHKCEWLTVLFSYDEEQITKWLIAWVGAPTVLCTGSWEQCTISICFFLAPTTLCSGSGESNCTWALAALYCTVSLCLYVHVYPRDGSASRTTQIVRFNLELYWLLPW